MKRKTLLLRFIAVIAAGFCSVAAWAQEYKPSRPIELLVHSAPGGGSTTARGVLAPPGIGKEVVAYWEDFFARLIKTASWKKYLEENQVEDVFLKGADLSPFFDEQIQLMRSVLQQAGVKVER